MLTIIHLLVAAWFAATISGAAGFSGALLLLPVLAHAIGAKQAIPVLTLARLLGNMSRSPCSSAPADAPPQRPNLV